MEIVVNSKPVAVIEVNCIKFQQIVKVGAVMESALLLFFELCNELTNQKIFPELINKSKYFYEILNQLIFFKLLSFCECLSFLTQQKE